MTLDSIIQKSLCGRDRFYPILNPNDLEGQGQIPPYTMNPIRDLPMMHVMTKYGDPSFNPSKVIVRTSPFLANFDLKLP